MPPGKKFEEYLRLELLKALHFLEIFNLVAQKTKALRPRLIAKQAERF